MAARTFRLGSMSGLVGLRLVDWLGAKHLRHAFHAPDQGGADLKEDRNLRAAQLLLGHTKLDSTVRYLGVDIEDALSLSQGIYL